jgi:hypothetical protein
MELKDANDLLQPGYRPLETGWARLDNGVAVVAALHRLHGISGAMLQWWSAHQKTQDQFVAWHPAEHVSAEYRDGVMFPVHNRDGRILSGRIEARPLTELFDADALRSTTASFLTNGRGGPADGSVLLMRTVHVGRDTEYGCEVRSRFWIGDFDPPEAAPPPRVRDVMLSDANLEWQMKHCIEEFHYLAQFLPDLYARENTSIGE